MEEISTEVALKYTKDLNILYVEDDLELQEQSKTLFEILFNTVDVASNGLEALKKYQNKDYDIVISDIMMPKMDGIELTNKIRSINARQCIIITSAYNDSDYLLKFINLNIRQFILKPINVKKMITILYDASKNIVNQKMIETYRVELENSNISLKEKNDELQSLVKILDSKLVQLSDSTNINNLKKEDLLIKKVDLNELKELEVDISGAAVLIGLSNKLNVTNIGILSELFTAYSKILSKYPGYNILSTSIASLGISLNSIPENFTKRIDDITTLLESFIYVLRMWRKNLVKNEIKKSFELHTSMLNDINTIISIIDGTENEIKGEMEFF